MIRLRRPRDDEVGAHLESCDRSFSYREVGATAEAGALERLAHGYDVDRHRFSLGEGRELFARSRSALLAWRHFDIPWLELHGARAPVEADQVVATLVRAGGLWFLNPCRVIYVERASDPSREAAFAYGTLAGHVERGEERFAVRYDPITAEVTYHVLAFSRPAAVVAKLARPWARRVQARFAASSAEALARACRSLW